MADNLAEILDVARREAPEVPDEVWARIEGRLRLDFGGSRPYIASQKKRARLEQLAALSEQNDVNRIAQIMGISSNRVRQLKKLR